MTRSRRIVRQMLFGLAMLLSTATTQAKVIQVGPARKLTTPCYAVAKASAGDIIEIDSIGEYRADVCAWKTDRLTLRGVGPGRPRINAFGKDCQGKGIWVIGGADTVIENIEFTGAKVSDQNGAAIRMEGTNLTIRNCYFHHNEEGILAGDNPKSSILIEFSEFAYNGSGDGRTHNLYINHIAQFTLRFCYSHHSVVGHLVKSRAALNYILYNRLSDEADGTGSLELDLPNGGTSYVIGNVIQQGPKTENGTMLGYRLEGGDARNPGSELYVVNNTFVSDRPNWSTFIQIQSGTPTPAVVANNIFYGAGTIVTQDNAIQQNNFTYKDPHFVNAGRYDYHLRADSPVRGAGSPSPPANGVALLADQQYRHPACGQPRSDQQKPDIGAFQFENPAGQPIGPPRCQPAAKP